MTVAVITGGDAMEIEAVSLDFYGTLVTTDGDRRTMAEVLSGLGFACAPDVEHIWNSRGFDGQRTPAADGTPCYPRWRSDMLLLLAEHVGVPPRRRADVVQVLLDHDRAHPLRALPGAGELLAALRRRGMPVAICSNWDYDLTPYLVGARLPADIPFVTSAMAGSRKPDGLIFERVRGLLGAPPAAILHLGDSWSADVVGAFRAGMRPGLVGAGVGEAPQARGMSRFRDLDEARVSLCQPSSAARSRSATAAASASSV